MKILFTAILTLAFMVSNAQLSKVTWSFTSKKIKEGEYEVNMTAVIAEGWHLYSQTTGKGPVPTTFKFTKNALLKFDGKVKENGKLISVKDKVWDNTQKYYGGTVTFTQKVKLKGKIKTNVSGEVEFMVCDDTQCLPPTTQKFNIAL
jgi:hypothetical protein